MRPEKREKIIHRAKATAASLRKEMKSYTNRGMRSPSMLVAAENAIMALLGVVEEVQE